MLPRTTLGSGCLKLGSLEIKSETEDLLKSGLGEYTCKKLRKTQRNNLNHNVVLWGALDLDGPQNCPELRQRSWNLYSCISQSLALDKTCTRHCLYVRMFLVASGNFE